MLIQEIHSLVYHYLRTTKENVTDIHIIFVYHYKQRLSLWKKITSIMFVKMVHYYNLYFNLFGYKS